MKRKNRKKVLPDSPKEIDQQLQDEYDYLLEMIEELNEVCGRDFDFEPYCKVEMVKL